MAITIPEAPELTLKIEGEKVTFDLDNPILPEFITENAFASGDYPYKKKLKRDVYEEELLSLQKELVKLQYWMKETGERIVIVFEGRDAAGKGGTINAFRQYLNPRNVRTVALSKPTETEQGQWYFQRYADHLPTSGEMVLFDRSWYNRAGVEPVMGFCSPEQHIKFLQDVPKFEKMLVDEGIHFFKIWLNVGQSMQIERFHDRRHNPLKVWKLSPIDLKALAKWDAYSKARNRMFEATHKSATPWTVVRSNDKRRARINAIRHVLGNIEYDGKDKSVLGKIDTQILFTNPKAFLEGLE